MLQPAHISVQEQSAPSRQITFFDLKWKIHKEFLPAVSSMYCLEVQKCELVRIKHVRQALEHGQLFAWQCTCWLSDKCKYSSTQIWVAPLGHPIFPWPSSTRHCLVRSTNWNWRILDFTWLLTFRRYENRPQYSTEYKPNKWFQTSYEQCYKCISSHTDYFEDVINNQIAFIIIQPHAC